MKAKSKIINKKRACSALSLARFFSIALRVAAALPGLLGRLLLALLLAVGQLRGPPLLLRERLLFAQTRHARRGLG